MLPTGPSWSSGSPLPIRPEDKARYPADWKEISLRVREEAGQKCEWCQKPNGQQIRCLSPGMWLDPEALWWRDNMGWKVPGERAPALTEGKVIKVILTVAHLDHQPENCKRGNLRALCQSCHLTYDAAHHAETRRKTKHENQTELPFDGEE